MTLPSRVALLSSGPPISLKVLYCLHRMGAHTHVIDLRHPSAAGFSRYRKGYRRISPAIEQHEGDRLAEFLGDYMDRHGLEAVVGGDIFSSGMLHAVQDKLRPGSVFPVSSMETLEMLDDKWRFHCFLEENAIPGPRTILLEHEEDLALLRKGTIRFPVIVKTLYGESGYGVFPAGNVGEIEHYLRSGSKYAKLPLLVQEFVRGYDADISVLAVEGQVVAHVGQSRRVPGSLEFFENEAVLEIAQRIVRAAAYNGVANIDIRIDEESGKVTVIECNPRFWYTLQASLWRGANFLEAGFAVARGRQVNWRAPKDGVYHLHGHLIRRMLWNPAKWAQVPLYNVRGLFQALSDPLPFIKAG